MSEDKKERRFSQEQYDMLKRCSDKKDMTEWNEWRKENIDVDIELEEAELYKCCLHGAFLNKSVVVDRDGRVYEFDQEIHPNKAASYLNNCGKIGEAYLSESNLKGSNLKGALFYEADLSRANISDAHLEGTDFWHADLGGANFHTSIVDGSTVLWKCKIGRDTYFHGVSLNSCIIDAGTKQLLEYNVRRDNWEEWYKEHWLLRWPVQGFWAMSDYGMSTLRVIGVFVLLALFFAGVYLNWAYWSPPGIVAGLSIEPMAEEAVLHYFVRMVIRPIYFSVVTMTTLGFGDMYANKGSIWGHILLVLQVILGYVLLGALITRFAVLFTAGGPAGKFAKKKGGKGEE